MIKRNIYHVLLVAIAMLSYIQTSAAAPTDWKTTCSEVRLNAQTGTPDFVQFRAGQQIPVNDFRTWLRDNLADKATFWREVRTWQDELGFTHIKYQQMHHGSPVLGGVYTAHARAGKVVSASGKLFLLDRMDPVVFLPSLARMEAIATVGARTYMWDLHGKHPIFDQGQRPLDFFPEPELVYAPVDGRFDAENFRLCWKFDVYAVDPLLREDVYVDVRTHEVIWRHSTMVTTDVPGTAITKYSGVQSIVTDSTGTTFRLRETGRGGGIETYDMNQSGDVMTAVDFEDGDNFWNNVNPDQDEVATDVHWGAEMTYDYFLQQHNRNSYDDSGTVILSYVHYLSNWSNARWDGQRMLFGDGGGVNDPFTSIDVVGHELVHGVTAKSAGLIYAWESGALNESFSDIFGVAVEHFAIPDSFNWQILEEAVPGAIRDMSNPNIHSDPDTYLGTNWWTAAGDNGGVHTNSGVQNFWFYLLTTGGSGTNDNGDPYNVQGLGIDTAAAIAYRNLTVYLTPSSNYADARYYAIQSAIDLYGICSNAVAQTQNAWHAVGVGPEFSTNLIADFAVSDSVICDTVNPFSFFDLSMGALQYHWDFGDGDTSNLPNPQHVYKAEGSYTVTLTIFGCSGSQMLARPNIVTVDFDQICPSNIPLNQDTTFLKCNGILRDNGGVDNYQDNSVSVTTIAPPGATSVTIVFDSFHYASAGDYLGIYDGPDDNAPVIGLYNGTNLPNGGSVTSTGGTITVKEVTNGFQNFPGFHATWSCLIVGVTPEAGTGLQVLPNPAKDAFSVIFRGTAASEKILEIMNVRGQRVHHATWSGQQAIEARFDAADWARGMYFIRISDGAERHVKKLILQ